MLWPTSKELVGGPVLSPALLPRQPQAIRGWRSWVPPIWLSLIYSVGWSCHQVAFPCRSDGTSSSCLPGWSSLAMEVIAREPGTDSTQEAPARLWVSTPFGTQLT